MFPVFKETQQSLVWQKSSIFNEAGILKQCKGEMSLTA